MSSNRQHSRSLKLWTGLLLITCLGGTIGFFSSSFTEEDAFISFQYARNLANGEGLVFNSGERVEGYTNLLWTLLMSLSFHLGLNVIIWAKTLGILFGCITIVLTGLIVDRIGHTSAAGAWIAAGWVCLDPSFSIWMSGGLETPLYSVLLLFAVFLLIRQPETLRGFSAAGVIMGLAALTRPEAIAIGLLAGMVAQGSFRKHRRVIASGYWGCFAIIVITHFIWRMIYYGQLLPNTFYAKVTFAAPQFQRGLMYFTSWAMETGFLFAGIAVAASIRFRTNPVVRIVSITALAGMLIVILEGGDWMRSHRFIAPLIPLLAVNFGALWSDVFRWSAGHRWRFGGVVLVMMGLLSVHASGLLESLNKFQPFSLSKEMQKTSIKAGVWMKHNAPRGAVLATGVLGRFTYFSELRVLDTLGLIDPFIARSVHAGSGQDASGHEKRDAGYILSKNPDFIVGFDRILVDAATTRSKGNTDDVPEDILTAMNRTNGFVRLRLPMDGGGASIHVAVHQVQWLDRLGLIERVNPPDRSKLPSIPTPADQTP